MKSILITGSNRGIGLGLIKALVKVANPPSQVIATCRDIDAAEELRKISIDNSTVHVLHLDLKELKTFDEFSKRVGDIVKEDGLNVLFNNAGISPKYTRIGLVKAEQLMATFLTNTIAPIMLTKALLPLLKQAAKKNSDKPMGVARSAVINMSSVLGSVENNEDGGLYPYRCSKAALNMATKTMSIDLKDEGILATCLHPGWVKTDMGGKNAPLDVQSCTSQIVKLLYELDQEHNGSFYQFDGTKMAW